MTCAVTQDLEERARLMKLKMKLQQEGSLGNMPHHRLDYDHHGSRSSRSGDYGDRHDRSMSRDRERLERSRERGYERGRDFERGPRSRRNKGECGVDGTDVFCFVGGSSKRQASAITVFM